MQRWLFILLAVVLGGFPLCNAHALTRENQPGYDAGPSLRKVVVVAGITMDTFQGVRYAPLSLHKYLYCRANPVNRIDPSGYDDFTLASLEVAPAEGVAIDTGATAGISQAEKEILQSLVRVALLVGATYGSENDNLRFPYYRYDVQPDLTFFPAGTDVTTSGDLTWDQAVSITFFTDIDTLYMYTIMANRSEVGMHPDGPKVFGNVYQFRLLKTVSTPNVTMTRVLKKGDK